MRIALFTNILSPHQLPLAQEIVNIIGEDSYRYIYTQPLHAERANMGWSDNAPIWTMYGGENTPELLNADLLITGNRAIQLIDERLKAGKKTIYCSERWFKPPIGRGRLLSPSFFNMAMRFKKYMKDPNFMYFPMGIHAATDFVQMSQMFSGKSISYFKKPVLAFESFPGGCIVPLEEAKIANVLDEAAIESSEKFGFAQIPREAWGMVKPKGIYEKMRLWGYFVSPSSSDNDKEKSKQNVMKVLWCGRMLDWKRVDLLVRAVRHLVETNGLKIELNLYGGGITEKKIANLIGDCGCIRVHPFIPVEKVREVMKQHDLYVLPSNSYEGWGAVINEALTEGMHVIASSESGAGATILPAKSLFLSNDYMQLSQLILKADEAGGEGIREWNPEFAAKVIVDLMNEKK